MKIAVVSTGVYFVVMSQGNRLIIYMQCSYCVSRIGFFLPSSTMFVYYQTIHDINGSFNMKMKFKLDT